MISFCNRINAAIAATAVGLWSAAAGARAADPPASGFGPEAAVATDCETQKGKTLSIIKISNALTAILDDGRDVRLSGLLFPTAPLTVNAGESPWPAHQAAHSALKELTAGAITEIAIADEPSDRHGRASAQMYAMATDKRTWIQRVLIERGHAMVSSRSGGTASCLRSLLATEALARQTRQGLWASAAYRVHDAADVAGLSRLRSSFAIVEGKVRSVTRLSGRLLLNFGDDWRTDFTAVVPKRLLSKATDDAVKLQVLTGHTIRVRGWIERRYGPSVEIFSTSDIEDLNSATAAADPTASP